MPIPPSNKRSSPMRYPVTHTIGTGKTVVPQTYINAAPNTGSTNVTPPALRCAGIQVVTYTLTIPAISAGGYQSVAFQVGFTNLPNYPQPYGANATLSGLAVQPNGTSGLATRGMSNSISDTTTLLSNVQVDRTSIAAGVYLMDFFAVGYGLASSGNAYKGPVLPKGQIWNAFQARGHVSFGSTSAYAGGELVTLYVTGQLFVQSN